MKYAAKRSTYNKPLQPTQEAWVWRVRQLASAMTTATPYKEPLLRTCLDELEHLRAESESIRHVPRILSEAGVRFVIVEGLPGAKIDGITIWLDQNSKRPVIGMALRFDRLDNFWFVLRHEIEHVLRKDGLNSSVGMIDIDLVVTGDERDKETLPPQERVATAAALQFCVAQDKFENWIEGARPLYSEDRILSFAAELGVHPGLVVGQLQYRLGKWDIYRRHLPKVRHIITEAAVSDGFGRLPPITT